jgi:hypothetical protein
MKKVVLAMIASLMLAGVAYAAPITFTDTTTFYAGGTNAAEDLVSYGWGDVNKLDGFSLLWL